MPSVSIIIPALNEASVLPATFAAIQKNSSQTELELIVVDAHSDDGTADLARSAGSCVLVAKHRHRGHQLNLGACSAKGEILLFLHADSQLPCDGISQIIQAVTDRSIVGGAFARNFDSPSAWLKLTCHLATWRGKRFGLFLGDQGMFVRASNFKALCGFSEQISVGEDLDFSVRLRKLGKVITLPGPLISSARRFDQPGPVRRTMIDLWLAIRILLGHSPSPKF